jgi:ribonuclease J
MLKIIPLGGLAQIGLNMMVFEYGSTRFAVDAGLMFPEDSMLGVDFGMPAMGYIRHKRSKLAAVVLTHVGQSVVDGVGLAVNSPVGRIVHTGWKKFRMKIQTALRPYFFFTIGRRPAILPFIMEV